MSTVLAAHGPIEHQVACARGVVEFQRYLASALEERKVSSLPGLRLVPGQKPGFLRSVTVRRHESLDVAWDVQAPGPR